MVVCDFLQPALLVYRGDGTGEFAQAPIVVDAGAPVHDFALSDINGDGRIDIVTANRDHSVSVLINAGHVKSRAVHH